MSSGEAELVGLTNGATHGIGFISIAEDLGIHLKIVVKADASAALGMARRLGVGKVRHLDTSLLWIQQKIRSNDLVVEKVSGHDNCADIMTKHPIFVGPDTPMSEIASLMVDKHVTIVPVVEHDRLIGMITKQALLRAAFPSVNP